MKTKTYYNPPFVAKVLIMVMVLAAGVAVNRAVMNSKNAKPVLTHKQTEAYIF